MIKKQRKAYYSAKNLDIQTNTSMGLIIYFTGFSSDDYKNWPNSSFNVTKGSLKIIFRNGMTQKIDLVGKLMRPHLMMNVKGFEPCIEEVTIDMGLVHITDKVIKTIWLANKSIVPASWKILYCPFPEKTYFGAATVTVLEKENLEKVDDPSVFNFNRTNVRFPNF